MPLISLDPKGQHSSPALFHLQACIDAVGHKAIQTGRDGESVKKFLQLNMSTFESALLVLDKLFELPVNAPADTATSDVNDTTMPSETQPAPTILPTTSVTEQATQSSQQTPLFSSGAQPAPTLLPSDPIRERTSRSSQQVMPVSHIFEVSRALQEIANDLPSQPATAPPRASSQPSGDKPPAEKRSSKSMPSTPVGRSGSGDDESAWEDYESSTG
ncbi:hypothetical protein Q7P37_000186 [Cladosporium fusiforme]